MKDEQIIKIIDFWKRSALAENLIKRDILEKLDYQSKEIVDLTGPRRSGKSSILKFIIQRLNLNGDFLYINFEDPFFITNNEPQIIEKIISVYKEYFSIKIKYIFFDEIQSINNWQRALRRLRDGEDFKIYITGSSSKLLGGEMATLLTGRHLSYQIMPLSFKEFLNFKNIKINNEKDIVLQGQSLLRQFNKYAKIGGFPEVVLTDKVALLKDYFFDITQRDIISRYDVREKNILEKMAVFLFSNSSKLVSIESLKKTFNISFKLASTYLEYLKEAFLIFELPQFSYSLKTQTRSLKKIYSIDAGLSNMVSFRFSEDKGRSLENLIFLELKRRRNEVYYYKTKNNLEVDFVVKEKNVILNLIQVSHSLNDERTRKREVRTLFLAMDELKLKQALIITRNEAEEIREKGKIIKIIPAYRWLLQNK